MPAYPEHSSDHASSAPNTDRTSRQSSTAGSSSTPYPPQPSRNAKPRDSLEIEPVDEGEKEIWRSVRQELQQMLDDAREHLESMIKANPDRQAALRKEHEETVVNCRNMAHEHYLEELAHEREERLWLSGQKPSPSLVKQQHGIMNRIQSSTGGATSSSSSASTSSATSSTVHNGDTRTKSSSSPPSDASESRLRNDSRSSMSRPLPSFTQQPYHIPPLPPQLQAARRTSHSSGGTNNRDEVLGDAAGHDTLWARHGAFDDELRRPPSTSTSSLRSKASINEFPTAAGSNGTSPTKASIFEHPRASSDRHHVASLPGNKPVDEFWTPILSPEEEAAAVAAKQHYPIDRRSSDASLRSMSSVASGRHPPSETIPARVDKAKDREYHERKTKDYFPASNFGAASRSPSSVSPAPGVSSSYPKARVLDDSSVRERELSDSPHISAQYPPRSHQGSMDDWPQHPPSAPRKSSRLNDPYDPYPYPSQTPYQDPAVRPTVMRSGSYSRPYPNYDMLDDPMPRTYASHSQSIPVPHRSPNPATMASSVDQPESFSGQSPGWRDWKSHQSPIPEDYTGSSYKSPSRNSFETRYKIIDEPSEPDHPGWRRRNEPWFRSEPSAREIEIKRLEEDLKKKESELISERTELRIKEERIAEREALILGREQKINRKVTEFEDQEKMAKEEAERLLKSAKSHEEGARRKSEETQKLKEEARSLKEEARRSMEEAQKSMEEVRTKESEVVEREEVVKNLEISTKELHARVEQTEKSLEAREKELKEKDHALKKKEEEMKRREEDFKKKVTDAKKKDLALNHRSDDISNRERAIGNRENEVKRKEEDLANRELDIRRREREAEMSKYDLEDRASSVTEREREVEMRDNSLLQTKKEIEADREELNKKWNELQKREHELSNKMKQKLEDEAPKEDEMERDREKREEEEKAHDRERREESEREEQRIKDQARMQREREIQEEQKVREARRRHVEEEERQRASEERRIREEVMKGRARRQEEKERWQEEKERRQEEKEKRQWGIGDEERLKEEEWKRQQELREAREKEEKERDERFKQEQERMRQQMEQQREARKRRDSSGPDSFWSSASGSNRAPPTRANSTTIPESRGTSSGPSGWGASAGSSGWSSSSGTSTGSSGWNSSTGASAWSSAKATSASSTASSKTQRKPSTNFGAHSSTSTSGTEKPKSIEEQNQATREKFRLEQERQETLRQAKLASAGRSTGDMMQAYIYHENQWETLPKHDLLYWDSFPWPMFTLPANAEQITAGAIWAYLKQDIYLMKDKSVSIKDRIKDQIKKWHPDRFETKLLPRVVEDQKEMVKEGAGNVVRCLNDLLEKAPSLMGW